MKHLLLTLLSFGILFSSCESQTKIKQNTGVEIDLAEEVKAEFVRSWEGYKKYAWGHDVLLPLSKSYQDWYEESLAISPIDAYSTMKVMGLDEYAEEVENYVIDSISWDKDLYVKTFEVNIRILGGLLAMYEYTGKQEILDKTEEFGQKMLAAFDSPTGMPYYWFNLKTGEAKGSKINVAEAASYMMEMGILSYYTKNPIYYQTAKKANLAVWERVSDINLVAELIDVESGEWKHGTSHICAGIDSYYEYLYKAYLLFGDEDLKPIWEKSIHAINTYLVDESDTSFWYRRVDMHTGEKQTKFMYADNNEIREGGIVTLYDAFFPAVLALSGDIERAEKNQATWDWLWNQYGLEPMIYDYDRAVPTYPVYDLNPEIIESAYYLLHFTGKKIYEDMIEQYWRDIMKYCRTDVAFSSIKDVQTMEKKDYMPTFFFAETMKYFYLTFTLEEGDFNLDDHIFTTEAHPFKRSSFDIEEAQVRLGF
ncbi:MULTISPECIES: glycoside hydrolase family 47 protein [unclassified Lentimicrobium]|uniref:glycoside hydrolase family 47 protein n=1 Tax=unclassified Lentimicrobium TaxID=2677434 RepID=UPI001552BA21|nr:MULTISPECIES: glycoside hydrolase family 47 protein [unclassified Lentimicrobium]NPD43971.1 glycoside hydrolase family 47 protein [Lentimicrobium sp. S6]NPD84115.1 glycoside hydrolase family 47 protein [Lentimicrobium sp. L6]